jgi:hypothetical protein
LATPLQYEQQTADGTEEESGSRGVHVLELVFQGQALVDLVRGLGDLDEEKNGDDHDNSGRDIA